MKKESIQYRTGLTLVEVMISLLAILVIVIGVMGYMYASARNAREADVRATAGRLGLLLMEGWKDYGVDITGFNPATQGFNKLPLSDFTNSINLSALPGLANLLQTYRIEADKVKYFVKLTYSNDIPKKLSIVVAWNMNYSSTTLGTNPRIVTLTDIAIY
jgi:hypothetical protein